MFLLHEAVAGAPLKGCVVDVFQAGWQGNKAEAFAFFKCEVSKPFGAFGNFDDVEATASGEGKIRNLFHALFPMDFFKGVATGKSLDAQLFQAFRQEYRLKSLACDKSRVPDFAYAFGDD